MKKLLDLGSFSFAHFFFNLKKKKNLIFPLKSKVVDFQHSIQVLLDRVFVFYSLRFGYPLALTKIIKIK